ncbi:Transcriptional activator spt7 [Spiromyces aspiralis]|uniref:Transcriptional activator spt7 n=2 Tax=Spiromyces aspiralis TaxID=68401 RepID=A0ACC1HGJ4_9FUNG|nr:Transcriptional activator spt7 [Spiromyces aspiralis]
MRDRGLWPGYLAEPGLSCLTDALESVGKWRDFIILGVNAWGNSDWDGTNVYSSAGAPTAAEDRSGGVKIKQEYQQGTDQLCVPSNGHANRGNVAFFAAATALRARAAIFEHFVDVINRVPCRECQDLQSISRELVETYLCRDSSRIGPDTTESQGGKVGDFATGIANGVASRKLDEDEDYDDDLGEVEEIEVKQERLTISSQSTQAEPTKLAPPNVDTSDGPISMSLYCTFRTLEYDEQAARETQQLESSIQRLEEATKERELDPKESLVHQLGSITNMKNLASFIDEHRDSVDLSTRELTSLLSEIRPRKTKWSSEERIGQEELYPALENVINELKGMGEIAYPFLNPVKKREAPDYTKIIKHPMDLGTMTKKLKSLHYNSKSEFWHDLKLIHDNCYTYNTQPDNLLRRYATLLFDKAKQLMKAVPDITIRSRSELMDIDEKPTELLDGGMDTDDESHRGFGGGVHRLGDNESVRSATTPGIEFVGEGNLGLGSILEEEHIQPLPPTADNTLGINLMPPPDGDSFAGQDLLSDLHSAENPVSQIIAKSIQGSDRNVFAYPSDRQWWAYTRNLRSDNSNRARRDFETPFSERVALVRDDNAMEKFSRLSHDSIETVSRDEFALVQTPPDVDQLFPPHSVAQYHPLNSYGQFQSSPTTEVHAHQRQHSSQAHHGKYKSDNLDKKRKEALGLLRRLSGYATDFVLEYSVASGLPTSPAFPMEAHLWTQKIVNEFIDTDALGLDGSEDIAGARPNLEDYYAVRFPNNDMWRTIAGNVEMLKQIRSIDDKIWATKMNIPIGYFNQDIKSRKTQGSALRGDDTELRSLVEFEAPYEGRPDPQYPLALDARTARSLLHRTCSVLLAHAGFESLTYPALACLTESIVDYMLNLGKTLRNYVDRYSRTMSLEAILSHSLYENGVESLDDLEYYIRDDLGRTGLRLNDINRKLEATYRELISSEMSGGTGVDSAAPMEIEGQVVPATDASNTPEAEGLEDEDAFVTGRLGELGEDFFGFKELGLDKEYGIDSLMHIPRRLWYGQTAKKSVQAAISQQEALPYPPPSKDSWAPIRTPEGQIGLLREFIISKLEAKNGKLVPAGAEGTSIEGEEEEIKGGEDASAVPPEKVEIPDNWEPIPEDEDLPSKAKYSAGRPKNPPPNPLTAGTGVAGQAVGTKKRPSSTSTSSGKLTTNGKADTTTTGVAKAAAPVTGSNEHNTPEDALSGKTFKKKRLSSSSNMPATPSPPPKKVIAPPQPSTSS